MDLVFQQSENILARFSDINTSDLTEQQRHRWFLINQKNKLIVMNQQQYDELLQQKVNIISMGCKTDIIDRLIHVQNADLNYVKKCDIIDKYNFLNVTLKA